MAAVTRRSLVGAMALVPALAIPLASATAAATHPLDREVDAVLQMQRYLHTTPGASEAAWEAWEAAENAVLAKIEALPCTPENARIKARGVVLIYDGALPPGHWDDRTTDVRLAMQAVRSLASA